LEVLVIGFDSTAAAELERANDMEEFADEERPSGVYPSFPPIAMPVDEVVSDDMPRSMDGAVGSSHALIDLYSIIDRVAGTDCSVLITGESGVGKELVARSVHNASLRKDAPFVAVNCGAIPEALLESELFGHARGAFTGAHATKAGRVTIAKGGTLFLDEIGELPLSLQVKLLRLLQNREYSPVGDNRTLVADVRIIAATNVDLEEAVRNGTLREDLYYRLNVIHVQVPSLRERSEDIPVLTAHFLKRSIEKTGRRHISGVSRQTAELLSQYAWPGNVRELENSIERAVLLCNGDTIEPRDLPARVCGLDRQGAPVTARLPDTGMDLRSAVDAFENKMIRQALERTNWNKKRAAQLLGLNRTTLVEMLKRKRILQRAA
jgi:transcriptional regulator with PAS, ATPase and Fis domain